MRKGIRLRSRNWRSLEARVIELTTLGSESMHRVENSIFGFREFSGKSEFPTRRVSSGAEGDKIEVAKLASFGSESNRTDDFWKREYAQSGKFDFRVS